MGTAPSWDFRRNTVAARLIVDLGVANGLSTDECLRGCGIDSEALLGDAADLAANQELHLIRNIVVQLGDPPGLGVELAKRFTLSNAGMLGFAMLSSRTPRQAIGIALRYIELTPSFLTYRIEESGDEARVLIDDSETPADVRDFLLERDLGFAAVVMAGMPTPFLARLELRVDATRAQHLTRVLPSAVAVVHSQPRTVAVFPRALLDVPMPQSDESTARMCVQQCEQLLETKRSRTGLAGRVRARLVHDPSDLPSIGIVAQELSLAPRTLRRRLAAEGTSYRELVDEVREALAVELLANVGLSVEEVARQLGYAETANFTHAFTRWRGAPPSTFRRK